MKEDMTIDDIKNLVLADESRTLELKKTTGELKDGMHSACAFLNTEGGWLIFGIAPKSLKIIGQEVTDITDLISAIGKSFLRGAKLADFSEYQRSSRILFSRFRSSMFLSQGALTVF